MGNCSVLITQTDRKWLGLIVVLNKVLVGKCDPRAPSVPGIAQLALEELSAAGSTS